MTHLYLGAFRDKHSMELGPSILIDERIQQPKPPALGNRSDAFGIKAGVGACVLEFSHRIPSSPRSRNLISPWQNTLNSICPICGVLNLRSKCVATSNGNRPANLSLISHDRRILFFLLWKVGQIIYILMCLPYVCKVWCSVWLHYQIKRIPQKA